MDEGFFVRALAEYPEDDALRLLFGDWLAERGDWRAAGYRWMGEHGKRPFDWRANTEITGYRTHDWYSGLGAIWAVPEYCTLPPELWAMLDRRRIDTECWSAYESRRKAEEALCRVVQALADNVPITWPARRRRRRRPRPDDET